MRASAPARSISRRVQAVVQHAFVTERFYQTWDFYTEILGFRTVQAEDEWVKLEHPEGGQLCIYQAETASVPEGILGQLEGRGQWLRLLVDDLEEERDRLIAAGITEEGLEPLEGGGQAGFCLRDPNGLVIQVMRMD
jgi:catechol 2,3-dioxygenase-like lactoylglutathione lyase family enzyme